MSNQRNPKYRLVRAHNRFVAQQPDELSLEVRDVLQVIRRQDRHWYYGRRDHVEGRFPINSVIEVDIDHECQDAKAVFVGNRSFVKQEEGDLTFNRNDILIGLRCLNENWYEGRILNMPDVGIFPITYAWQVNPCNEDGDDQAGQSSSDATATATTDAVATASEPKYATVLHDMSAKLENELNLSKGDVVRIHGEQDSMFYSGELNGQKGIFPKSFVSIITKQNGKHDHISSNGSLHIDELPSYEAATKELFKKTVTSDIPSYGTALYAFEAEGDHELSFQEGQLIHLIRYVDRDWIEGELDGRIGMFPKSYIEIIVDCEHNTEEEEEEEEIHQDEREEVRDEEPSAEQTVQVEEYAPGTKAEVLYDFDAQMDGDLTVRKGDQITLLRKFNNDWVEAYNQLELGICPFSYIRLLSDQDRSSSSNVSSSIPFDNLIEFSPERKPTHDGPPHVKGGPAVNYDAIILAETDQLNYTHVFEQTVHHVPTQATTAPSSSSSSKATLTRPKPPPVVSLKPAPLAPAPAPPKPPPPSLTTTFSNHLPPVPSIKRNSQQQEVPRRPPSRTSTTNAEQIQPSTSSRRSLPSTSHPITTAATTTTTKTAYRNSVELNEVPLSTTTPPEPETQQQLQKSNRESKMEEQRACVITELLQSERDYLDALQVCQETFAAEEKLMDQLGRKGLNVQLLQQSIGLVIDVSSNLVDKLQTVISKPIDQQLIGICFIDLEESMSRAYAEYCRMHADFQPTFERCEQEPELYRVLQRALERIRCRTNCFDIPSMLIKPVQRILKYPLLLNELIKCTQDTHADKADLLRAIKMITELATNINEVKRRKDLVGKYRREAERQSSFSSRLSKLNMHTLKKKYSRFNFKFSSSIGLAKESRDEDFEAYANHFRALEKSTKLCLKNLTFFMDSVESYVRTLYSLAEEISLFYGDRAHQPLVEQCKRVYQQLLGECVENMKSKTDSQVEQVLKELLNKFSNPSKLIDKRKDKLIDFDRASRNMDSNKDSGKMKVLREEYLSAKSIYEALHQQLLQELPKFVQLGTQVLLDCVLALITIYKRFIGRSVEKMLPLLTLPPIDGSQIGSFEDIVETFTVKHNLIAKKLVEDFLLIPANIFPQAVSGSALATAVLDKQKLIKNAKHLAAAGGGGGGGGGVGTTSAPGGKGVHTIQTEQDKLAIINNIHVRKQDIYSVIEDYDPIDLFDLRAKKGDLVVIIKRKDPTGLSSRWFVDNGKEKGFLPEKLLEPQQFAQADLPRSTMSTSSSFTRPIAPRPLSTMTTATSLDSNYGYYNNNNSCTNHDTSSYGNFGSAWTDCGSVIGGTCSAGVGGGGPASILSELEEQFLSYANNVTTGNTSIQPSSKRGSLTTSSSLDEFDPLKELTAEDPLWSEEAQPGNNGQEDINLKRKEPPCNEYYRAAFAFHQIGPKQLNLALNEIVVVKYKCDLHQNPEWWYVENQQGVCGYVPANYLSEK